MERMHVSGADQWSNNRIVGSSGRVMYGSHIGLLDQPLLCLSLELPLNLGLVIPHQLYAF